MARLINKSQNRILRMVQMALLVALVFVLQTFGSFIKIGPLPLSFVLVPIVIGAIHLGPSCGAILGGVFGFITMIMGISGVDVFSHMLWEASPIWFIIICLLKAILAGLGSAVIYKGLNKLFGGRHVTVSTIIASVSAPIINTGIFVVGMLLFFGGVAESFVNESYTSAVEVVLLMLAGFNFLGEFAVNLVLSPAIVRIVDVIGKRISK